MFNVRLECVEEQLFAGVSVNSNRNGSFLVDVQQIYVGS